MPGVILLITQKVYTRPMNIPQKLSTIDLPSNSFVVVGSGILNALGIRESNDIDLIVTKDVFDNLEKRGYAESSWPDQKTLTFNEFEFGTQWFGKDVSKLLRSAEFIDSVPYLNLDDVYEWKSRSSREKDRQDCVLIEQYRNRQS